MFHIWAEQNLEAVEMQTVRLLDPGLPANYAELPETEKDDAILLRIFRAQIDLDFYFIALRRLLRVAEQAMAEGYGTLPLKAAVRRFLATVPKAIEIRDWGEHPDEVLRMGVGPDSLGLGMGGSPADVTFSYGNTQLSVVRTTKAARNLFEAIDHHVPSLAPNEVVKPLKRGEAARAIREGTRMPDHADPRRNRPDRP